MSASHLIAFQIQTTFLFPLENDVDTPQNNSQPEKLEICKQCQKPKPFFKTIIGSCQGHQLALSSPRAAGCTVVIELKHSEFGAVDRAPAQKGQPAAAISDMALTVLLFYA